MRRGVQRLRAADESLLGLSVLGHPQLRLFSQNYHLTPVGKVDEGRLSPKDIVKLLDEYVIGQPSAKQEVSVALRERWRRLQLPDEKAEEITPKNMLVSGPSGCGKTEIIRRVSKLLKAPFVKVDASTFTRRGVVGANVSDMIVDLYDNAEDQAKDRFAKEVKAVARNAAEDIIVDAALSEVRQRTADAAAAASAAAAAGVSDPAPPPAKPGQKVLDIPLTGNPVNDVRHVLSGLTSKLRELDTTSQHQFIFLDGESGAAVPAGAGGAARPEGGRGDADFNAALEELLAPHTLAEIAALEDDEAKSVVRERLLNAESTSNRAKLTFNVLAREVTVEDGDAENEVLLTTESKHKAAGGAAPLMQLLGGQQETARTVGTVKELLRWTEEEVVDALSNFHFAGPRSPIKDLVEKWGIVCIDEIDKVVGKQDSGGGNERWMNTDVQQELLTLVEGTKVNLESARMLRTGGGLSIKMGDTGKKRVVIDTTHILFVCAGAFTLCKPQDMLIELLGRLPVRVTINSLTEENLYSILTGTKYPLVDQQTDLFRTEDVDLVWEEEAVREIAKIAWNLNNETQNTGARVLASILRSVLSDLSYQASDLKGQTVTITKELVLKNTRNMLPPEKRLNSYVL